MSENYIVNKELADKVGLEAALLYQYIRDRFIKGAIVMGSPFGSKWVNITDREILRDLHCLEANRFKIADLKRLLDKRGMIINKKEEHENKFSTWYSVL